MGVLEEDMNSLLYWYPTLNELDVRTPETRILEDFELWPDDVPFCIDFDVAHIGNDFIDDLGGYPVFVRTDKASDKHHLNDVSRVEYLSDIQGSVGALVRHNFGLGLFGVSIKGIVFREWLDVKSKFRAFYGGGIKIGCEMRVFVGDGEVKCHHYYWPKDSIDSPNSDDWEESWEELRDFTMNSWDEIKPYAQTVAEAFEDKSDGWWSVDFAYAKGVDDDDYKWYCIDMARAEDSAHPWYCEYSDFLFGDEAVVEGENG